MNNANKEISSRLLLAVTVLGGFAMTAPTWATVLAPGSPATVTPGLDTFSGLSIVVSESVPFVGTTANSTVEFSGILTSAVYDDASTGNADFAYQLTNSAGSAEPINFATVDSYSGFSTDVDYIAGTGTTTYSVATRKSVLAGDTISLNYAAANVINPGGQSDWVIIKTNANSYDDFGLTSVQGVGSDTVDSFEPAIGGTQLPEPMSLGLLMLGGSLFMSRRPVRKS